MDILSGPSALFFDDLREANKERLPEFKNSQGELAHVKPDGSDWSLLEWAGAACGEAGELANICKKVRRGDMTLAEARPLIARELADVVCYCDLLASQADLALGECVKLKFNEVSEKVGSKVRL